MAIGFEIRTVPATKPGLQGDRDQLLTCSTEPQCGGTLVPGRFHPPYSRGNYPS